MHALSNCNWGFPDLDWSNSKTGDDDDEPVCQCVILESVVWDFITVSNVAAVANATTHQPSMDSCAANLFSTLKRYLLLLLLSTSTGCFCEGGDDKGM